MFVGKFKCRNKREKKRVDLSNLFVRVNEGFNLGGNVSVNAHRSETGSMRLHKDFL